MDQNILIRLGELSEPPIIEEGFELVFLIPRSKAPSGFHVVLKEHGLEGRVQTTGYGLALSFTTTSYPEFVALQRRFLHEMPWSEEIRRSWVRSYQNIRLTRHVDEQTDVAGTGAIPDEIGDRPIALSRGIRHDPRAIEALRQARAERRALEPVRAPRRLPAPVEEPDADELANRAALEAMATERAIKIGDQLLAEVTERFKSNAPKTVPPTATQQEGPVPYKDRDVDDEILTYLDVYGGPRRIEDVAATTKRPTTEIEPALARLVSEGRVTLTADGYDVPEGSDDQ